MESAEGFTMAGICTEGEEDSTSLCACIRRYKGKQHFPIWPTPYLTPVATSLSSLSRGQLNLNLTAQSQVPLH